MEALELSLQAIAGELVESGEAEDEEAAEEQIDAALEEKRAAGAAGKRELDLLAHLKEKCGSWEEAEAVMQAGDV